MSTSSSNDELDDLERRPSLGNDDVNEQIALAQLTRYKEIKNILNILIQKLDFVCKAVDVHNKNMTQLNYKVRSNKKKLRRINNIEHRLKNLEIAGIRNQTVFGVVSFVIGILASAGVLSSWI